MLYQSRNRRQGYEYFLYQMWNVWLNMNEGDFTVHTVSEENEWDLLLRAWTTGLLFGLPRPFAVDKYDRLSGARQFSCGCYTIIIFGGHRGPITSFTHLRATDAAVVALATHWAFILHYWFFLSVPDVQGPCGISYCWNGQLKTFFLSLSNLHTVFENHPKSLTFTSFSKTG